MSTVQYDEKFDEKVREGALAIMAQRNIAQSDSPSFKEQLCAAEKDARIVLLTAMAIDANMQRTIDRVMR